MKTSLLFLIILLILSCKKEPSNQTETIQYHNIDLAQIDTLNYLTIVSEEQPYEFGVKFSMIDRKEDTIVHKNDYYGVYSDTIKYFGIFQKDGLKGFDRNGNLLFDVFQFDNGPDYLEEGLFRVVRNGKIGYANKFGEIMIECQFDCAYPFKNGLAQVSKDCKEIKDGDHSRWESENWFFIDKTGKTVNPQ